MTALLETLNKRARASAISHGNFRPTRPGILEEAASEWHHFIVGRRGVGKSMLLLNAQNLVETRGCAVAYLNIEALRDNPYPDVLIRLLILLADALSRRVGDPAAGRGGWFARRRTQRELDDLSKRLNVLLKAPMQQRHQLGGDRERSRLRKANLSASAGGRYKGQSALASGEVSAGAIETDTEHWDAEFTRTKMEGLQAEAIEFRSALAKAVEYLGGKPVYFILDDFYFIPRDHQPDVLSYLHQVVKDLPIWLKVGAVEHRLREFDDGDPPKGLQLNQDAAKLSVDSTLADFNHTKTFLEGILNDICDESGVSMDALVTPKAAPRLVMASGGVPRDYLNLVRSALSNATKRPGSQAKPKNRIIAEDVTAAAPEFLSQREADLKVDASPHDQDRLLRQLQEVLTFCLSVRKTNVFLVESRHLRETEWGRDIKALSDLRFFHIVNNTTVKSSEPRYVGRRYDLFALDLSSYAESRVMQTEIPFWTSDGLEKARSAQNVFTPDRASEYQRRSVKKKASATGIAEREIAGQLTLQDAIEALSAEELDGPGVDTDDT